MDIFELRNALSSGIPIEFKTHCLKRMLERNISRKAIFNCVLTGEIIEDYPLEENNTNEASLPMCLILKTDDRQDKALHVVVGYNGQKMIFISAYRPDTEHWEADFKTRKESE